MRTALLTAALVCSSLACAQSGPMTLKQCIDYALSHNITIKRSENTARQQDVDLSTARNSRLPDLNAGASEQFNFGRGLNEENTYVNRNTQNTSLSLATSVPLFTGMRIPNQIAAGKLNLEASMADLEHARQNISLQVTSAYLQAVYTREVMNVNANQVELSKIQEKRLEKMLLAGKASETDVAEARSQVAQDELAQTQAQADYRLALLDLSQLLELPSPEGFSIVRPDTALIAIGEGNGLPVPDEIYQEALAFKPEVRAETLRLKGAEVGIGIAKSALWPTLSLTAGLGSNYYKTSGFDAESFGRQMRNNFSQYIGLSLNVPIFNRLETRNSIRAARLNHETQQLQLDNVKKTLYKEIQQAYYNAVAARAQYASSREATRSNKAAFDLMSAKYEYGKANITEFNEAKNNWLTSESELVRAKYEYMYSTSLLDFYRGKQLSF